eukprot:1156292-Pelagomonas_calceolata.AAC.1
MFIKASWSTGSLQVRQEGRHVSMPSPGHVVTTVGLPGFCCRLEHWSQAVFWKDIKHPGMGSLCSELQMHCKSTTVFQQILMHILLTSSSKHVLDTEGTSKPVERPQGAKAAVALYPQMIALLSVLYKPKHAEKESTALLEQACKGLQPCFQQIAGLPSALNVTFQGGAVLTVLASELPHC